MFLKKKREAVYSFSLTIFTLCTISISAQTQKIVGYFPSWAGMNQLLQISFDKLTHINYAFVQSDHSGNVVFTGWGSNGTGQLTEMINRARQHNVTVMVSVHSLKDC